jgi:hypothetical protein
MGVTRRFLGFALVMAASLAMACGDDSGDGSGGGGGGGEDVTCTVGASIATDSAQRTATGVGDVTCDGEADLAVTTCVQWDPSGSFEDIQCASNSVSGATELTVENVSSCGLGAGRQFRAQVNVTIDGEAQPEQLSTVVGCD